MEKMDEQITRWLHDINSDDEETPNVAVPDFDSDNEEDGIIEDFRAESLPLLESEANVDADEFSSEDDLPLSNFSSGQFLRVLRVPNRLQGKDGYRWTGVKPVRSRTRQRNIIQHPQGPQGVARQITTEKEAWSLFFSKEKIDEIVKNTNVEIIRQRGKYKRDRPVQNTEEEESPSTSDNIRPSFAKDTNLMEIEALIGLYYLTGVLNMNHVTTKELFDKNSGVGYFRATMTEARFEFLTNCLRFDDRSTREERRENDRLAPIRDLFDHIVNISNYVYSPSDCCTLDEMLLGFRGRCVFKMYIPSKPDKYGIKIIMLCDSKTAYMIRAVVYLGKDSAPRNIPSAHFYTMTLTEPIHGTNRNLTCDNWFTSIPVAKELLTKQVTIVGTLRKNKREIPSLLLELKNRDRNTAKFVFSEELTLLSYCPPKSKQKKVVTLLSTMHTTADPDAKNKIPEMVEYYNKTKCGVDLMDQLCHKYSVSRKTRRWPMAIFYGLLNIVGVNSFVLFKMTTKTDQKRRKFLKNLALALITPQMEERFTWRTLPTNLQVLLGGILQKSRPVVAPVPVLTTKKRCAVCPRGKDRKTKITCGMCRKPLCGEHTQAICEICLSKKL